MLDGARLEDRLAVLIVVVRREARQHLHRRLLCVVVGTLRGLLEQRLDERRHPAALVRAAALVLALADGRGDDLHLARHPRHHAARHGGRREARGRRWTWSGRK